MHLGGIMAFNKIGTPQPLHVVHKCACGNPATQNFNGTMYCDNCAPEVKEETKLDEIK